MCKECCEMKEIVIAICEDNAADSILMQNYLEKAEKELEQKLCIHTFQSADDFFKKISPAFDMIFLTTSIPDLNLKETVHRLQACNYHHHLILVSSCPNTVTIGYEYGAKNHLVKPVSYVTILNEIRRYLQSERYLLEPFLWISNKDGHFKLFYSKLRYVETENRHLAFHYEDQIVRHTGRMSNCVEKLPDELFFRCNNSYIVNLNYISHIVPEGNRYSIHLITGEALPLSRSRYRNLLSLLSIM